MNKTPSSGKSDTDRAEEMENYKRKIRMTIDSLSFHWDLRLPLPPEGESPAKQPRTIQYEILSKVKFLCYKDKIDALIAEFETKAAGMYSGWVLKPKAERGVNGVPEKTRQCRRPVSDEERQILLDGLLEILNITFEAIKTPKKNRLGLKDPNASIEAHNPEIINLSPIPFPLSRPRNESKRPRELFLESDGAFKKPRMPGEIPDLLSTSFDTSRSSKVSFASDVPSIFSNPHIDDGDNDCPVLTQNTDITQESSSVEAVSNPRAYREPANTSFKSNTQSSEYEGASSFDVDLVAQLDLQLVGVGRSDSLIDEELSQDMAGQAAIGDEDVHGLAEVDKLDEAVLQGALKAVFPELPPSLRGLPFRIGYEIARIFLYAGVSLSEANPPPPSSYDDYDEFWKFLKDYPPLREKPFPERCSREVWDAAIGDFTYKGGPRSIFISGSLRYEFDSPWYLFRLQLCPLSLDDSHRLGRRFGHDRFLEIDVPDLTGQHVPKMVQKLAARGPELIIKWLVDGSHNFLGRTWKPFFVKPKERPRRKAITTRKAAEDLASVHRVTFFAVDGDGFLKATIPFECSGPSHVKISIDKLINRIRPTRKNVSQSFLKLFSRTALALSRNTPTVVLEKSQIRYKEDIQCEGQVMTDGGGQISPMLALKVTQHLQLDYFPSAFQARLGEAKGLWTVNHHDQSLGEWIEVYKSQQKWTRSTKSKGESDDISQRTFEVLKCSATLKSATLNLQFLPLLMDGAKCKPSMRESISQILEAGLLREITSLKTSMETPQSFRKWVRDTRPNVKGRTATGAVTYQAGLPSSPEERMNALLDAGFDAKRLLFMKEIARTMFKNRCDELKERLNITVGCSTHVLMVPDFSGVLGHNEIYIDLSDFTDKDTGLPGPLLNDSEILVARSPAHLVSDIQKVKATLKVEFMGLKNVIVFPTKVRKGTLSLAARLSGGDFDGDIAWVCWDRRLVDNFENSEVPEGPNLLKEGYIRQDLTTYEKLVNGHTHPASLFLKKAFEFNMQPSLLGRCTVWKEEICYAQGSVRTQEAVRLSTLLGLLVDQYKQGFMFTEDDRIRLQQEKVKVITQKVLYKGKVPTLDAKAKHIVDRLKYVANETVEKALTDFQAFFPDAQKWDSDLSAFHTWAEEKAKYDQDWARLLKDLDSDIKTLKSEWAAYFDTPDDSKPDFVPLKVACYEKFQAIQPHENTAFTQALSSDCFPDPDISSWSLLKASALFASYRYRPRTMGNAVWWFAGRQLCFLKAIWTGNMTAVAPWMYAILGPMSGLIRVLDDRHARAQDPKISSDAEDAEEDD